MGHLPESEMQNAAEVQFLKPFDTGISLPRREVYIREIMRLPRG